MKKTAPGRTVSKKKEVVVRNIGGAPLVLHIKVCLLVLGSFTAYVKQYIKLFVAPEGAVPNLKTKNLNMRKKWGYGVRKK